MADLKNPKWMYLKGALFVGIMVTTALLLWLPTMSWYTAVLIGLLIWASARAYYFAFYVIENYIDADYKFAGLIDFLKYLFRTRKK